jgi:hypothetical protein
MAGTYALQPYARSQNKWCTACHCDFALCAVLLMLSCKLQAVRLSVTLTTHTGMLLRCNVLKYTAGVLKWLVIC